MERLSQAYCLALCRQIAARLNGADVIALSDEQAGTRFEIRRDGRTLLEIRSADGHLQIKPGPDRSTSSLMSPGTTETTNGDLLLDLIAWMRDDAELDPPCSAGASNG